MRRSLLAVACWLVVASGALAAQAEISNGLVSARPIVEGGKIVGVSIAPAESERAFTIYLGSAGNIIARRAEARKYGQQSELTLAQLRAQPTPLLGRGSYLRVRLYADDPYPRIDFRLNIQRFDEAAWQRTMGNVPFHFLAMPLQGAEIFYQRGWHIPTPVIDPYPLLGNQTGYGQQIRSHWDRNWTYAPPIGAYPVPAVGLWKPSDKVFVCYDFTEARLSDHSEKDIGSAYVWQGKGMAQFITLVWPWPDGYIRRIRWPQKLPAVVSSHFRLLWNTDAPSDRDPNVIWNEYAWQRYGNLMPEVPQVNDLSWLPDTHRPARYGPVVIGRYYRRISEKQKPRWWKPGALVFGGPAWDRSPVFFAYERQDEGAIAQLEETLQFMAQRVRWMTIDGDRCAAWQEALEGEGIEIFGDGVPTVHNIQTWQMGYLFLDAVKRDPQRFGKYADIVDGILRWTKHFLYTRNGYHDVPCAQFCWGAAPAVTFCLRYYYAYRDDPSRRELAQTAYRLARNVMYHYLPMWATDNNEMDWLDSSFLCEPNSGISWLGSACSNEVWCVAYALAVAYVATGDPVLGHYLNGAIEQWHELFRDEWYPTVRQYDNAFSEQYYLYPGRGPLGGRVTYGGLWGQLEQIAWPVPPATVRIVCGEKAAVAFNRSPGEPTVRAVRGRLERLRDPDPRRCGRHTGFTEYRYYGNGEFSLRIARYGLGQPEPFSVDLTFPEFDLRGKPVFLKRAGRVTKLVRGRDYEEMPNRPDTIVVHNVRYGDVIGVGRVDINARVLRCEIARARRGPSAMPVPKDFALANLWREANRRLSFDWEDPASWAGLEPGLRWILGVPFEIIDPDFNGGRVGVRDRRLRLNLPGRHLFVLVGELSRGARLEVVAGGRRLEVDLGQAVPVLRGWPPCFEWEVLMADLALPGPVSQLRPVGCTLFAATTYTAPRRDKLAEILAALRGRRAEIAQRREFAKALAEARQLLESLPTPIAILPSPGVKNPRGLPLAKALRQAELDRYFHFLTPQEFVNPDYFNAQNFRVAVYAGDERYYRTVGREGDGDEALLRFLSDGGVLLVLPRGPFPFYYDQDGKVVVNAAKFGLPICGPAGEVRDARRNVQPTSWEEAPRDVKLVFRVQDKLGVFKGLPKSFPFPLKTPERRVDERWRPIVNTIGDAGEYIPLISLYDNRGRCYGDGAAVIEYKRGPLAPGKVMYIWHTLLSTEGIGQKLYAGALRWAAQAVQPPLARGVAYFTSEPIRIDGKLDERAWQEVPGFELQQVINTDQPPNQPTTVKVRWDRENLYVAFICQDSDIWSTMRKRDQHLWEEEVVEVFVDWDGDGRDYKEFEVNPLGTVVDLNIPKPGHGDLAGALAWDSRGWRWAVSVDGTVNKRSDKDRQWICEMAIPLRDLAPPEGLPRPGTQWRVNFYRIDRPNKEDPRKGVQFSAWSPVVRGYHEPHRFGRLVFAADPLRDDFSLHEEGHAPGPPWKIWGGAWRVRGGVLVGRNCGSDGWIPVGIEGGAPWLTDYRMSVRFRVVSRGSDWRDGPWFGVRASGQTGYFVEFTTREIQVHKAVNGRSTGDDTAIAWIPLAELAPGWHALTLQVSGSGPVRLQIWLDGKKMGDLKFNGVLGEPAIQRGGIALAARRWSQSEGDTVVEFDDLRIEPLGR